MFDAKELLNRFVAIEREATVAAFPGFGYADAYPRWFAASERFPYWTNVLATVTREAATDTPGDEASAYNVTVWTKLVAAHITAGLTGEVDERFLDILPDIVLYFDRRRWLQSAAYPLPMKYLETCDFIQARFVPEFPPTPAGTKPMGAEFQFRCRFIVRVEQAYLG